MPAHGIVWCQHNYLPRDSITSCRIENYFFSSPVGSQSTDLPNSRLMALAPNRINRVLCQRLARVAISPKPSRRSSAVTSVRPSTFAVADSSFNGVPQDHCPRLPAQQRFPQTRYCPPWIPPSRYLGRVKEETPQLPADRNA